MSLGCAALAIAASCILLAGAQEATEGLATCSGQTCSKGVTLIQHKSSPAVDINNNWLIVNNKWYSRKGAHDAWLGRVGSTHGVWVRPVLINFETSAPEEWLHENVKVSTTLTLSAEQSRKIRAAVGVDFPAAGGQFSGEGGITHNSSHDASYVLRGLTFDDTWRLKSWFNDEANGEFLQHFRDMYSASQKARIVTTVWIMVSGEDEHAMSCTGGHLSLNYTSVQGRAGFHLSGAGCTQSTWSFSPNTVIAYQASYLEFENMHTIPPRGRVRDVDADWYWTR